MRLPTGDMGYVDVAGSPTLWAAGEEPNRGYGRLVRWAEVAAWSGLPLDPYVQFHSVALPPDPVDSPPPWSGQGPREGSLFPPDAIVVIEHLRQHTKSPKRCWFCLWDGYGWQGVPLTSDPDGSGSMPDGPIPEAVDTGPRVRLPDRNYYLYRGPIDARSSADREGRRTRRRTPGGPRTVPGASRARSTCRGRMSADQQSSSKGS